MKIVLVIPTLKQGGAERVMSVLANEFSRKGHEVHLCLLAGGEHFYELEENVIIHDFGFVNNNPLQKIMGEVKVFSQLRNLLKSTKPDLVLSFMTKYNVLTIMASSFLNINVFVSDRSNPKKQLPNSIVLLRRITYKYATGVIAQTSLAKEMIEKETGNKNVKVIPNPLKELQQYPEKEKEKIILNVGRMVPEKGQKYILEAFSRIPSNDWKLVILGNGPLRMELEEEAKRLNITHQLIMPGAVKNVDEWLAKSSIFAFPSVSEGFPNALVEAMSAGLPCVSFDCDAGPRDIIQNEVNGYLVPLKNINLFAQKLNTLMQKEELRIELGQEAIKIKEELEPSMITDKFITFCSGEKI
jgi:glycosyltransferase involved in cell wall biosynthesis